MILTKANIVAWNGERGIAYDAYGNAIHFTLLDVIKEDRQAIREGLDIVRDNFGLIELATSQFVRFAQELINVHTVDTEEIDLYEIGAVHKRAS